MRLLALLVLSLSALPALAAPMYKCVGPDGKISYSTHECEGKQRQTKEFQVTDPSRETEEQRTLRVAAEREKLRAANEGFRQRQGERDRAYADEQNQAAASAHAARASARAAASRQADLDRAAGERGRIVRQHYCANNPQRC
jgi:hypothetical protein